MMPSDDVLVGRISQVKNLKRLAGGRRLSDAEIDAVTAGEPAAEVLSRYGSDGVGLVETLHVRVRQLKRAHGRSRPYRGRLILSRISDLLYELTRCQREV